MNKLFFFQFLTLCILVALSTRFVVCPATEKQPVQEEPPFPQLIDPERMYQHSVHIVIESLSDEFHRETIEEYVDFVEGKNTFIKSGAMGHSVKHLDAARNIIFQYKPYECFSMTAEELDVDGMGEIWKARTSFKVGREIKTVHLYGVAAIWLNAEKRPKKFTESQMIFSASRDAYDKAWKWTLEDQASKQNIHLFFIPGKKDVYGGFETRLEMIQFESMKTNEITRTFNILELRREIDSFAQENLMQPPVGYGCIDESVIQKSQIEHSDLSDFKIDDIVGTSHRIDLEVTYTNYGPDSLSQPTSQTVYIELARHKPDETSFGFLHLIRQRDSSHDFKTVIHHLLNVQYDIDYRKGSCDIKHVDDETDVTERLLIKFDDQVAFDPELFNLHMLFGHNKENNYNYYFVKEVISSENVISQYYETTLNRYNERKIRFVRVYILDQESGELNLDYVTAYLFNDKLDHIIASYQFNLIEVTPLANIIETAKLFDVSAECYLNNEQMRVNTDYSWFQVDYPLQAKLISKLANRVPEVKADIYASLYNSLRLSFFRVPRIELIFTETGMTLRALMIDLPKLHILFRNKPKTRISSAIKPEIEIDVEHCAELCRLNKCKTMSYCEELHICSMIGENTQPEIVSVPEEDKCTSYFAPEFYYKDEMTRLTLHGVISELQHQDYNQVSFPKIPEELLYSDSETAVSQLTKDKLLLDYMNTLQKAIRETGLIPTMTFSIILNGVLVIMLPNKFLLEDDPMEGFDVKRKDSDDYNDFVQPFHQGLVMKKFAKNILSPQIASKYRANLFKGLNYDQCAMACSDSRCSSFSYCEDSQECLITDIYNLATLKDENLITEDTKCFISQRDFLSRFNKFPVAIENLYPSLIKELDHSKLITNVINPSECAHICVVSTDLDCLSFDFCRKDGETMCIFYKDRRVHFGIGSTEFSPTTTPSSNTSSNTKVQPAASNSQCDHYTRSYLADFTRIEYRRVKEEELGKVKTSSMEGVTVYECAEECVNHLVDCTAFQFCLHPQDQATFSNGPLQSCVFIESRPTSSGNSQDEKEFNVVLDETDGRVLEAGQFFEPDTSCQVFSLRKDSTVAQVRELALANVHMNRAGSSEINSASSGTHILSYLFLYIGLTLVFTTLGSALLLLGQRNEYLRQKIERIQILLNM